MTDLDERLASAGSAFRAQPVPDLDVRWPSEKRTNRWLAPVAVAASVAAVVAGVAIIRGATDSAQPPARPAPVTVPDREFAVSWPTTFLGPGGAPRLRPEPPPCVPGALRSSARTLVTSDGVVGVIRLAGKGCSVRANPATLRLVDSAGRYLPVPTRRGVEFTTDLRAEDDGSVKVGFAWTGSYCGDSATVELKVLDRPLRIPLTGPLPACHGRTRGELVPGSELSGKGDVVPPPQAWSALSASIELPATIPWNQPVPLVVVLTNHGKADVSLAAPCATWTSQQSFTAGASATSALSIGDFCSRAYVVPAGRTLRLTLDGPELNAGSDAARGSVVSVSWAMSGVPPATASTRIR